MRGEEQLRMIRQVVRTFGKDAIELVFVGGTVIALYARPQGSPLRTTTDVDCISTMKPWIKQAGVLGDLCQNRILKPDTELSCRYMIIGTDIVIDVLSPEGLNVGGVNPWFPQAIEQSRTYDAGEGVLVRAVTPPYFVLTKLVAFKDRGPDAETSKDAEDIVAVAIEVADIVDQVEAEGVSNEVRILFSEAFEKYGIRKEDIRDFTETFVDGRDGDLREQAVSIITRLAGY